MIAEILILRLVHVLAGTFWVGTTLFTTAFLLPSLREAGPAAFDVMAGFQKRRLMVYLPALATLTLLSGFRLLWIISGGFAPSFLETSRGLTFTLSGILATVAFLLGMFIGRPANLRAAALGAQLGTAGPEDRVRLQVEMARSRERSAGVALVSAVLLVLATGGMAIARYL